MDTYELMIENRKALTDVDFESAVPEIVDEWEPAKTIPCQPKQEVFSARDWKSISLICRAGEVLGSMLSFKDLYIKESDLINLSSHMLCTARGLTNKIVIRLAIDDMACKYNVGIPQYQIFELKKMIKEKRISMKTISDRLGITLYKVKMFLNSEGPNTPSLSRDIYEVVRDA